MKVLKSFKGQQHVFDLPEELAVKLIQKDRRYTELKEGAENEQSDSLDAEGRTHKRTNRNNYRS